MKHVLFGLMILPAAVVAAEELSPFTEVEFEGETPFVQYEGKWYELLELEGMRASQIVGFCRKTYGDKWDKRFAEDLIAVLGKMGKRPGDLVKLLLKSKDTGKKKRVKQARMTRANRKNVREARRRKRAAPPRLVVKRLTAADAAADVKWLRDYLEQHHSYQFRLPGSLDRFAWTGAATDANSLALALARMVAPCGDGHTRVRGRWGWLPKGYTPFLAGVVGKRIVAMDRRGLRFLADGFPYVRAIDGVPIQRWLDAAQGIIAQGSPQFRLWTAAEYLDFVSFLRRELGLKEAGEVRIELESEDGKKKRELQLPLVDKPADPPRWPETRTRLINGNIGYLRIADMRGDSRFLARLREAMESFRKTRGLVIDVRGNGGGSRHVLRELLPHFLDKPRVVNAAKYRLPDAERPENPQGHLDNRFLYPLTWVGWSGSERKAVKAFARKFKPEWDPPAKHFSNWHFMVVSPARDAFRYRRPVVVLMDARCFSATDIFLGAFKGVPGVTLVGTPSGGGSGRSAKITLPRSGIRLRVSSMASFQPNGKLYDGNGVEPDVFAEPTATDWIQQSDTPLDAAFTRLTRGAD